ncbi:MAG: hypothetical protein FWG53_02645 [Clostridiales bacterium]|nr:hypothetical protein [Clostridiales bacterium]
MTNRKFKKIMTAAILILIVAALAISGRAAILENKRIQVPDGSIESTIDEFVGEFVKSSPRLDKKILIGSEDIAKVYARVLYKENYEHYEECDNESKIWVKHYEEYGVWLALLHEPGEYIDGPPWIIFQDSDGKVIRYAN